MLTISAAVNVRETWIVLCLMVSVAFQMPAQAEQRARPYIDGSLGYQRVLTDRGTLMRGVSLSLDGGDPYGSLSKNMPSQSQLDALVSDFGLNTLHLYLEGNSSTNPDPVGINAADADLLVQRTADAGMYLIITIGNNGENGTIHDLEFAKSFWDFYAPRYQDQTHVIYEAHNEPAAFTPSNWTLGDWANQIVLYNQIRSHAPDTFTLLGSFMGFAGDPTFGTQWLTNRGVDWSNAGFAHHGYESKAGIENAIGIMQSNPAYPALLATEFFPGDTEGQGYNSMYESRHNGWMQFQWLGADDNDLLDFRAKINVAGTVWTPDDPDAMWPARGTLDGPADGSVVGLFHRGTGRFVATDAVGGHDLVAGLDQYTSSQNDAFTIDSVGDRLVKLRAANGMYLTTAGEGDALTADGASAAQGTTFEWIRMPNGDVVLRAYNGGGHLLRRDAGSGKFFPDGDNGRDAASNFVLVASPGTTPVPLIGNPFHGVPASVPGIVQAEDFDLGGEGAAYQDADPGNNGGAYRTLEDVDIEVTSDIGGGFNVGFIAAGETMDYTIEVPGDAPAEYIFTARVAAPSIGGRFYVEFDGVNETGVLFAPNTGGFQNWADVSTVVTLEPGVQIMRFVKLGSVGINLNYFSFELVAQLAGDYNGDGLVEQGDLDLVLNNWGQLITAGFSANADGFATVIIDQEELDRVLNHWGSSTAPNLVGDAVPEPAIAAAVLAGLSCVSRRRRSVAA